MKTISIRIALLAAFIGSAQGLAAEPQPVTFHDRMLLDIGPNALVPSDQPAGLGGSLGFGLAFRDFNLFLRGTGMIAEPGLNQRTLIIPTLRTEARIHILPNFITLLPYFDVGGIMTKVKRLRHRFHRISRAYTPNWASGSRCSFHMKFRLFRASVSPMRCYTPKKTRTTSRARASRWRCAIHSAAPGHSISDETGAV
jgi:hypothetical protein